jgi:hypothetical protein
MNWLGLQSDQATYYWLVYTSTRDDEAAGLADAARTGADACADAGADAGAGRQAGPSRLWKISRSGREERGLLSTPVVLVLSVSEARTSSSTRAGATTRFLPKISLSLRVELLFLQMFQDVNNVK